MNIIHDVVAEHANYDLDTSYCNAHSESQAVISSMVNRGIQSAISYGSTIVVECDDAVVTLYGYVDSLKDRNNALRAAIGNPCIRKVVDKTQLLTD